MQGPKPLPGPTEGRDQGSGVGKGTVAQYPADESQIATGLAILAIQGKPVEGFIPSPIKLLTKADVK